MKISLSASAADTWAVCLAQPSFVAANRHRIPDQTTVWNTEGDMAHAVMEAVLLGRPIPTHSRDKKIPKAKLPEMVQHAKGFREFCLERFGPFEDTATELDVQLWYMPGRKGRIDFAGMDKHRIAIHDLKYGSGVAVSAEGNRQMAIYARSLVENSLREGLIYATELTADTEIAMRIYQPRVRDGETESEWVIKWPELEKFTDEIHHSAGRILAGEQNLPFQKDEKACRFCPAKTFCPTKNGEPIKAMPLFDKHGKATGKMPAVESLTEEQLEAVVRHRKEFKSWVDDAYKLFYARALAGNPNPNWKLVKGRGHRKWDDSVVSFDEILENLGVHTADGYKLKPLSPNQIEGVLKEKFSGEELKERLRRLRNSVQAAEGAPTLVPFEDPRPALVSNVADIFDNLDEEQDLSELLPESTN